MKRLLIAFSLSLSLLAVVGCPTPAAQNPPTAPAVVAQGYLNQADEIMGQTLAGANAFYNRLQKESAAGTVTFSAQEKTALNGLGTALNIANPTYLAYHNGAATQAQAQAAVDTVSSKRQTVQQLGVQ